MRRSPEEPAARHPALLAVRVHPDQLHACDRLVTDQVDTDPIAAARRLHGGDPFEAQGARLEAGRLKREELHAA